MKLGRLFLLLLLSSCFHDNNSSQAKEINPSSEIYEEENSSIVKVYKERIDIHRYFPKLPEKEIFDTVFIHQRHIRIIKSTLMNSDALSIYQMGDTVFKDHYRDNKVELQLEFPSVVNFDGSDLKKIRKTFTKYDFNVDDKDYLEITNLMGLWFIEFNEQTHTYLFHASLCQPETDYAYFFIITIDSSGKMKIVLDEIT